MKEGELQIPLLFSNLRVLLFKVLLLEQGIYVYQCDNHEHFQEIRLPSCQSCPCFNRKSLY